MPMTKNELLAEAMALAPEEREALAEELWLSLDGEDRESIDAAWLEEARRRDAAYASGQVQAKPADEVVQRLLSTGPP